MIHIANTVMDVGCGPWTDRPTPGVQWGRGTLDAGNNRHSGGVMPMTTNYRGLVLL